VTRVRARAAFALALLGLAVCSSASAGSRTAERTVELTIRHSRFSLTELTVTPGEKVRFVVRNDDPIDHELIVGPMAVQLRHETGREASHPPVPGEVSIPIFETAETTYTFDEPDAMWFGCHLPAHWDYGMQGRIVVR
jgi:uncharacterized cupredoxin-like copper-binding protein